MTSSSFLFCLNLSWKCERISHGFRYVFPYLLKCELNEFLQHTANVSHQLHSSTCREGKRFRTLFKARAWIMARLVAALALH